MTEEKEKEKEKEKEIDTHGAILAYRGAEDDIKRELRLIKSNLNNYLLLLETWWDGDDKEPTKTVIKLGEEAFEGLVGLIAYFRSDPDRYKHGEHNDPV